MTLIKGYKLMKLCSLALLLAACLGCGQPITPQPKSTPVNARSSLVNDVKQIATLPRPSGSAANRLAGVYIENELKKLGLEVQRQFFPSGVNIIGIQRGQSAKTFIIGAHYDSVFGTPGADDNASGSAMTLLMAKYLNQRKLKHTIHYVFFDAEERGMIGSNYYAKNMREQCDFMLNFDMVGNLRPTRADPDTIFFALFKRYPWAKAISKRQGAGPSDHAPFQRKGIPFVWIFTGDHNRYHKATDTPASLNYDGMVQISQYALDMILNFDKHVNKALIRSLPARRYSP